MSFTPGQIIAQAMVHLGELESAGTPSADQMTDGMIALNGMQRSMFGTVIGVRLSAQSVTGIAWQAENGGEYAIPAGTPFTLTAPLNPRAGARFGVVDAGADFATNPCTISPNGRQIQQASGVGNLVLNVSAAYRWWYRSDTGIWLLEQDYSMPSAGDFMGGATVQFPNSLSPYLPYMLAVVISAQFGADIPPSVVAAAVEGRAAFARAYARRGRNQFDPSFGISGQAQPPPSQPQPGR